ncbi:MULTISPECIES: 5-fold beta-flower protein [unclassified Lonepinella]|uniref:5-fold beta-flower protein n=1 Tax=unclassified Lonepinella TaxID=2642006 RepID=UPI003F6DC65E
MAGEYFKDGYIFDSRHTRLGRINGDYVEDSRFSRLGRINGNYIEDARFSRLGRVDGQYVQNSRYSNIGKVSDFTIKGIEREKDAMIAAVYHFLIKKIF